MSGKEEESRMKVETGGREGREGREKRHFYTAKLAQWRLGTPCNFTVLSQIACVQPRG